MTTIRITAAAFAFALTASAQASEITNFELPTGSTVSRAEVQAEAHKLSRQGLLRVDELGPVATIPPMSTKSREQVRSEAAAPRTAMERMAGSYLVGGN